MACLVSPSLEPLFSRRKQLSQVVAFNFKDYLQYSDTVEGSYCPQHAIAQSAGPTAMAAKAPRMVPEDLYVTFA